MENIILHHYQLSPFAHKIRSLFGYTNMDWQSVTTSEMPPRNKLEPLAGKYRKIPVAQIGADIFCDSRTIQTEIARLASKPELAVENCSADVETFLAPTETTLFFALVGGSASFKLQKKVMKSMSLIDMFKFFIDRVKLSRTVTLEVPRASQMGTVINEHLSNLEAKLNDDFLFGSQPNIGDFGAYHALWFYRDMGEKQRVKKYPKVMAWMDRMKAFGEGNQQEMTAEQAWEIAKSAEPRPIPEEFTQHEKMGQSVTIAPSDYGQVPTSGKLVGSTPRSWIIERNDERVGTVNVHFPKNGFTLS